jgi:hypothetical protein
VEDFEVMADGWLTEAERRGEVADACFAAGLGLDEAEEAKPCRIGEDA